MAGRRRSFGAIRQKPNGNWEARYRDKAKQTHYRYFITKAEAEAHLSMVHTAMLRDEWIDPGRGRVTLAEWSVYWMRHKRKLRPRTAALYEHLLRCHIVPAFGAWPMSAIKREDVDSWLTTMHANENFGATTEARAFRLLNQMFKSAVKERTVSFNPCDNVDAPSEPETDARFLTAEQVEALADAATKTFGRIDVWMNIAGVGANGRFWDIPVADYSIPT